ncbi:MAG: hypothetical protein J7M14_01340, partial [Planctomycetes bacterium]|nr:hypothetical protein [Planctomycetota bacterium]
MNTLKAITAVLITGILVDLLGCVSPGNIEPTTINNYQEQIAQRRLERPNGGRLDLLKPAKALGSVPLDIRKDPKTGKT